MSEAQLRVARRGGLVVWRLEGELRHLLADALEHCIEQDLGSALQRLVIDLSGATFIDSTLLGMLVLAARRARAQSAFPPLLICPEGDLWDQLVGLHLDGLFQRIDAPDRALPEAHPVALGDADDPRAQAALVLRAHQALVRHDPRNAETFAALLRVLQAELERAA